MEFITWNLLPDLADNLESSKPFQKIHAQVTLAW